MLAGFASRVSCPHGYHVWFRDRPTKRTIKHEVRTIKCDRNMQIGPLIRRTWEGLAGDRSLDGTLKFFKVFNLHIKSINVL